MSNAILETISEIREDLSLKLTDAWNPKQLRSGGGKVGVLDKHRTVARNLKVSLDDKGSALIQVDVSLEVAEQLLQKAAWNSKKAAHDALEACITELGEAEDLAESESGASQAVARLPEIEATVLELMQTASTALLSVGQLMNEAREEFDKAKDFLSWALDKFGFKKAYVYRLMSVADTFKQDDILAGQSINVLHKLAAMPEEVKQEARDKVESGETLTGAQIDRLTKDPEPEPIAAETEQEGQPELERSGPPSSTAVDHNDQHEAAHAAQEDVGAPWNDSTGTVTEQGASPELVSDNDDEVKRLRELVSELQAELAAQRQERSNSKPKAVMPMLPQFKSSSMYARLGMSAEDAADTAKVRKAFRELVKAGYDSKHEGHSLILEARDALMQEKAAA